MAFGNPDDDGFEDFGDDEFEPREDSDDEESPEALRAKLAASQEALTAERQRLDALLRGPSQPKQETLPPLGPPPDPAEDRDAYLRWDAERERRRQLELEKRLETTANQIRNEVAAQTTTERLWSRFTEKYPRHAKREALVRAAYRELDQAGRLPQGVEAVVDAVRTEMDRMIGAPANRTASVPQPNRPLVRRSRQQVDEVPQTMHDSIVKQKRKFGLV